MIPSFDQKVAISEQAMSQEVNGETVILDLNGESYFGLDNVGTRIWQLLHEDGDLKVVFDILQKEFDVDANTLSEDMKNFIDDLIVRELVKIVRVGPG